MMAILQDGLLECTSSIYIIVPFMENQQYTFFLFIIEQIQSIEVQFIDLFRFGKLSVTTIGFTK